MESLSMTSLESFQSIGQSSLTGSFYSMTSSVKPSPELTRRGHGGAFTQQTATTVTGACPGNCCEYKRDILFSVGLGKLKKETVVCWLAVVNSEAYSVVCEDWLTYSFDWWFTLYAKIFHLYDGGQPNGEMKQASARIKQTTIRTLWNLLSCMLN